MMFLVADDIDAMDAELFEQMNLYGQGLTSSYDDEGFDWVGPASDLMIIYF